MLFRSAGLRGGQRAAGPRQGAERDWGRRRGSGTRRAEETCGRLCVCREDSEAEPAPGRAGRALTHTPADPAPPPESPGKEGHGLALGFRIVLEFGLLIPKKIIKSHVQK